jgi:radial spoke head protein 9
MEFNLDYHYFNKLGFTINIEERASINASLVLLRDSEKFERMKLWGKIIGIQKDYWIAEATGADRFKDKKYFYRYILSDR